ncbi:Bug family tripartite tricarboxylate transporter substrate binding protein [Vreelandella stevensii]|uniref:Bug family tripartite tricarboxylate transporter substrate binding protein n=1 Tax=Vreelandella stevensii TaxID=502821 RepID=UPI00403AFA13
MNAKQTERRRQRGLWSSSSGWGAIVLLGWLSLFVGASAHGQPAGEPFPDSELTLVVPYGEGGATDVLFRAIAERARVALQAPIVVVNMPGSGATLGAQFVKEAPPDGYTVLGSHQTIDLAYLAGLANFSHEAFAPIALLTRTVNMPATYAGHSVSSASQIAEKVREQPGKLRFGVIPNSTDHFFWLHFFAQAGIAASNVQFVQYPDTGAQVVALLGRELDFAMLNLPSAGALFASGALVPLGVASEQRLAALPSVPTLLEQGITLVNTTDRGLFAPLNTPPERLASIATAFRQALESPDLEHHLMDSHGSLVDFRPLEAYGQYLDEQYQQLESLTQRLAFER